MNDEFESFIRNAKFSNDVLVVFDLDCTMWPFHIDMEMNPPFRRNLSNIFDSRGKKVKLFPDAENILKSLKTNPNIKVACASRTTDIEGATNLLQVTGWNNYFDYQEIYPCCKVKHFESLKKKSKIDYNNMVFFDDFDFNLNDVKRLGVKGILVKNGIQFHLVKNALMSFL